MIERGTYFADRYEILELIGQGGMSHVYKAKDHVLGRDVSLKVLKSEFAEDITFVTKFRAEAQAAAGLEHPNIVNIYDVGSQNGIYYIVMELVEGVTLKTYIERKGRLNYKEMLSIAIQVGRGIEAAHNKQIIHRDIKPHNIMISRDGKVKVTDFGIAKAVSSNTFHADNMGSVHYMSPEQARNGYVTYQSDIYSLGIVMYEMSTGRVPYDGDSTVTIALKHLNDTMEPPSKYAPDLPVAVEQIILKATQKSADRRYSDMAEMLMDMRKALMNPDEEIVAAAPPAADAEETRVITAAELEEIQKKTADSARTKAEDDADGLPGEVTDDDEDEGVSSALFSGLNRTKRHLQSTQTSRTVERLITIGGVAAAVILVIVLLYMVLRLFGPFGPNLPSGNTDTDPGTETDADPSADEPEDTVPQAVMVAVPDLFGKTQDEALQELAAAGLKFSVTSVVMEDVEEGRVAAQNVPAGTEVEMGSTVEITVSAGVGTIGVPDVVSGGWTEENAARKLEESGFKVAREWQFNNDVPENNVIAQMPAAGSAGRKGDVVTIYISQGRQAVQVPTVRGMTEEEARNALGSVGLNVGNVTRPYSDSVEEGRVISQGTAEGSFVEPGSSVDLVISRGQEVFYYFFDRSLSSINGAETTYVLFDASGAQVATWVIAAGQTQVVHQNQLTTPSGTLAWEYVETRTETVTDENGESQTVETEETVHDSESVTFIKQ